ncbi:MAG: OmpA family protein [Kiritimatiellae bacterium]|nr:OmpA family protein [Kiritimatiellia bacterium]
MKFSTIMAVLAVALAAVATGCKYDKAGKGGGAAAEGSDINGISGQDINGSESGSISSASEGKFEDLYTRCTDVDFSPVYFGFDSTVVPQGELGKIDAVVKHLTERTDRVVVVEGNCDERGSSEYNMSLGENRAIVVRNYLVNAGIAANRIQTRSYGAEKPAVDGHDESAWALNRRSEFAIYQK